MSDKLHLLIPGAFLAQGDAPPSPPMPPRLRSLLSALAPTGRSACAEDSLSTPFEMALAPLLGLPQADGRIPWAALESGTIGAPCAWVKPCHLRVGADHIILTPLQDLALDEATSQALLAAMAPYFFEDGIALRMLPGMPGAWLATGEPLRDLATLSPERAAGRRMTPADFNAGQGAAATIRRLQNEMQMLLYTHPVNDARQQQGLPVVNSFWVAGAGVLKEAPPPVPQVLVERRLQEAARHGDAAAHEKAWSDVDADACARLLALLRAGGEVQLTLCGDRAAQTFGPGQTGPWSRFLNFLGLQPAWDGGNQL